jgi:outer membrane protein assembly factor BamA
MAFPKLSRPVSLLLFTLFFFHPDLSSALNLTGDIGDEGQYIVIGKITLDGNKRTRPSIILRELKFHENDTLAQGMLPQLLKESQENVFNTRLFNIVTLDSSLVAGTNQVDVSVNVIERWYIWPIPYLTFADRNFNVWWETKELSRLTYGVDLTFYNMRGRNETLTLLTHLGYDQLYGFTYKAPYINRRQTLGIGFGAGVELNHEVAVETIDNQPQFISDPSRYMRQLIFAFAEFIIRPGFYTQHTLRFDYNYLYFADTVVGVKDFTLNGMNLQQLFYLTYQYKDDHRDVQYYPLKGYYFDMELIFGMPTAVAHDTYIQPTFRKYWQIYNRWYWASGITAKVSIFKTQPYYLQQGLGYNRDYVRGYEYYVADGQHFVLLKNNLKFALIPERVIRLGFINTKKFNTIPLALYLNAFCDLGYVYNYQARSENYRQTNGNTLENTLLAGFGMGLDFTTYYDFVLRMELSMNRMGEAGLYLHFIAPI